jgi:hypothetical protein
MLNNPMLARAFASILLALGLYLAIENMIISAQVLQTSSGASLVTSFAIAVASGGLELTFASWVRHEKGIVAVTGELQKHPAKTITRLFFGGLGLAVIYHFDLLTTSRHPSFQNSDNYFFSVIVIALVFGPEACIVIASWLWHSARDGESRHLDKNTTKEAENRRLKSKRDKLVALANEAGEAEAIATARQRWGGSQTNHDHL